MKSGFFIMLIWFYFWIGSLSLGVLLCEVNRRIVGEIRAPQKAT